jgi:hypothetical protein
MKLYEQLKSGKTAEELIQNFKQEIEEAQARIDREQEQEKRAAREKEIAAVQHDLWLRLKNYITLVSGTDLADKDWEVAKSVFDETISLCRAQLDQSNLNPDKRTKNVKEISNILPFLFL